MTPKKKASLTSHSVQSKDFIKQQAQQNASSYLAIQDKASHLMPTRRVCPHLSLNPLNGNSLY